jgi:hypothetical protein
VTGKREVAIVDPATGARTFVTAGHGVLWRT